MTASELRIGNFIYLGEKVIKVNLPVLNRIGNKYYPTKPIPITEEWLLKAGFVEGTISQFKGSYFNMWYEKYMIQKMQNKWTIFVDCDDKLELLTGFDYVHQLQNLYFALTGEELTYD